MERSPNYDTLIESMKHQESTAEKQEQAKLLRMELLLDNALLTRTITDLIREKPDIAETEVKDFVTEQNMVIHPEATERFITELFHVKEKVLYAQSVLDEDAEYFNEISGGESKWTAAQVLFYNLTGAKEVPTDRVEIDSSYPLAMSLYVWDPSDFEKVAKQPVAGSAGVMTTDTGADLLQHRVASDNLKDIDYPVVIVKGSQVGAQHLNADTVEHEQAHAENSTYQKSMENHSLVWGHTYSTKRVYESINNLLSTEAIDKNSGDWNYLLNCAFTRAKDEVLAMLAIGEKPSEWIEAAKTEGGNYDYFRNLQLSPSTPLYHSLRTDYEATLDASVESVDKIVGVYQKFGLIERSEMLRWVLAQIPFEKWEHQLDGTYFTEEVDLIEEVHDLFINHPGDTDRELYWDFQTHCEENQRKPLVPYLRQLKKLIELQIQTSQMERNSQVTADPTPLS